MPWKSGIHFLLAGFIFWVFDRLNFDGKNVHGKVQRNKVWDFIPSLLFSFSREGRGDPGLLREARGGGGLPEALRPAAEVPRPPPDRVQQCHQGEGEPHQQTRIQEVQPRQESKPKDNPM